MATRKMRVNLAAATFPLLSKLTGRAIIIPAPAGIEAAVRDTAGSSTDMQKNQPQPIYMQNFLPIPAGLGSAIVNKEAAPTIPIPKVSMSTNLYVLRDELDTRVFYLSDSLNNWIYNAQDGEWVSTPPVLPPDSNPAKGREGVTIAYLKGQTYVCIDHFGIYIYDVAAKLFKNITGTTGIDQYKIKGITAVGPYLIAYDDDTIYWSNVNDPLDFVPSLITGAGSTKILAVKSIIVAAAPIPDGFIVYTAHNAVAAMVTGDMGMPFVYNEIEGFTGLPSLQSLSYGNISSSHIAWTPTGLVEVTSKGIINSFSEITIFIQGKIVETFDETVDKVISTTTEDVLNNKLRIIGGRYLTVSYSLSTETVYTHALIFDIALKRWGKIAFPHIDIFESAVPSPFRRVRCNDVILECNSTESNWDTPETPIKDRRCNTFTDVSLAYTDPSKILGLVGSDGLIHTVMISTFYDLDTPTSTYYPKPVVVLGDYALERKAMTDIVQLEVDHVGKDAEVDLETYITYNGESMIVKPQPSPLDPTIYNTRTTGRNHTLRIKGNALLSTIILEASSTGNR